MVRESGTPEMDLEPLLTMGDLTSAETDADRVNEILQGLAQVAVAVIRGAEAASLTMVGPDGSLSTSTFTEPMANRLDSVQYSAGQGPCLDAAKAAQWSTITVPDLQDDSRWPAIESQDVAAVGVRSVLSVSLFPGPTVGAMGAQQAVGSLNVYSRQARAFGESERDTGLLLALYAALALAATEAVSDAGRNIDRLKEAMANRNVIGQAQGILMERHKFTAGQAFDRLRKASMSLNRKLRDVARDLSLTGEEAVLSTRPGAARVEADRLRAVTRYDILDTTSDAVFDRIAAMAARVFGVPMATVSIVDTDRVWFKASLGMAGVHEIARDPGLCASVVLEGKAYHVTDARSDPRTAEHPLVTGEPGLRFYAAAPITTADGDRLGTVAVMDLEPREATPEQLEILVELAGLAMDQLELRFSAMEALRSGR